MKYLTVFKELLPLLSLKYVDNTRRIDSDAFKKSDSYKLLKGVKEDRYNSEEEMLFDIYGDHSGARNNFRDLANKTLAIFFGNLFLKPTERKTDYKSVYQDCNKKVLIVLLLKSEGRQNTAKDIAINTLKKSIKYHITEASKVLSRELMLRYQVEGEALQSEKYKEIFEYYSTIEELELAAYTSLNNAAFLASRNKKPQGNKLHKIIDALDMVIQSDVEEIPTFADVPYNLTLMRFRARVLKASFLNDHKGIFSVYSDLEYYLKVLNFRPPVGHLFNIKNKISPSLIITSKFEEARNNIKECLATRLKGELNWHISLVYQAILGFHSKDYQLAKETIQIAKKYQTVKAPFIIEWWKIAEAYLYFLSIQGQVKFEGRFRLAKFLNDLSVTTQDKTGTNVSILVIAEFLIKLAQGNRDPLIEKNESIRLYNYNNLEGQSTKRSRIFLDLLRTISRCGFDPQRVEVVTRPLLDELNSLPLKIEDLETELIRYEELFRMVVAILKQQSSQKESLVIKVSKSII